MDIQTRKIAFIQEFLKIQSEEVLSRFETLLKKEGSVKQPPLSMDDFNRRIDQSENHFQNGNFKTASELLTKYK